MNELLFKFYSTLEENEDAKTYIYITTAETEWYTPMLTGIKDIYTDMDHSYIVLHTLVIFVTWQQYSYLRGKFINETLSYIVLVTLTLTFISEQQ